MLCGSPEWTDIQARGGGEKCSKSHYATKIWIIRSSWMKLESSILLVEKVQ